MAIPPLPIERVIERIEAALGDVQEIESRRPRVGFKAPNFIRPVKLSVRPEISQIERHLRAALAAAREYESGPRRKVLL